MCSWRWERWEPRGWNQELILGSVVRVIRKPSSAGERQKLNTGLFFLACARPP